MSALDEMPALTDFDDIVSNGNINEATQLLFIELIMHLNYKLYLLKLQPNCGFRLRFVQISRKGKTIIHLLDKIKCHINSTHHFEILLQIKLGKQQ